MIEMEEQREEENKKEMGDECREMEEERRRKN